MRRLVLIAITLSLLAGIAGNVTAHLIDGPTRMSPDLQRAIAQHNDTAVQDSLYTGPALVRYEAVLTLLPPLVVGGGFALVLWRRQRRRATF
jgi:hypothetical protein